MTNVFVTQIVEAVVFGIMWLVFMLVAIFWQPRARSDRRILRLTIALHSLASLFIMIGVISLLMGNGCLVGCGDTTTSKANSEGQWGRFIGYSAAGATLFVATAVYHMMEIAPTVIGTVFALIGWVPTIFTVLNGPSMKNKDAQVYWGVLGAFFLFVTAIWTCFYSRLRKQVWDWLPILTYFFGSILIWTFLWVGPDSSKRIGDTATVAIYAGIYALFVIILAITIGWGWGFRIGRKRRPVKTTGAGMPRKKY